jgi:hypothetical protein
VGIRRIWDALQLVQILGLSPAAIAGSTTIVTNAASPDVIAASFKNAVRAQYTPDRWRPIAKSVFDPLRRKKRDALVSYLVTSLGLQSSNQLFEYFLVDPGMEPVVQTSRLRLALSSVQTFIDRCFLNLENGNTNLAMNVAPSAIPADLWAWMKRYRVWEANRKIFLFPENWMEPELRLDKTDLFQALESALLQGDVTRDLVEGAFLDYLNNLDVRARLDIVASYLDQDMNTPGNSVLYVLGRTYGQPHQYFFRTYSNGGWSGWQPVSVDIDGDHMALAIWRGRLNLFWLTFVVKAQAPTPKPGQGVQVTSLGINDLERAVSTTPQKQIQIQLHWSDFVQGKWTNRISTDVTKSEQINVGDDFDPRQVHIRVSNKERDSSGNEGAIRVHVDLPGKGPLYWEAKQKANLAQGTTASSYWTYLAEELSPYSNRAFRKTSKNSDPDFRKDYYEPPPPSLYIAPVVDATCYAGASKLTAFFQTAIQSGGAGTPEKADILSTVQNFELLTCSNPVVPPFVRSDDPDYQEAGSLVSPFFFKDTRNPAADPKTSFLDERTFFVEPSLTETVISEWDGWAIAPVKPAIDANLLGQVNVIAQVPVVGPAINPGDPAYSIFPMQDLTDWVTHPAVAITYGGVAIGKTGGVQAGGIASISGISALGSLGATGSMSFVLIGAQGVSLNQIQAAQAISTGLGAFIRS